MDSGNMKFFKHKSVPHQADAACLTLEDLA